MNMSNQSLRDRTKQFALRVVRMFVQLPKSTEAQVLGKQVLRSGTSVAANYREASRARSDAELQLRVGGLVRVQLFEQQARLDVVIVLVLVAGVLGEVAGNLVIENLADRHPGVHADLLHGKHLQGPVAAKAHVAETGRDVHE